MLIKIGVNDQKVDLLWAKGEGTDLSWGEPREHAVVAPRGQVLKGHQD